MPCVRIRFAALLHRTHDARGSDLRLGLDIDMQAALSPAGCCSVWGVRQL